MEPARYAHREAPAANDRPGDGAPGRRVYLRVRRHACGSAPRRRTRAWSSSAPICPSGRGSAHISATSSPASAARRSSSGAASVEMIEHVMAALAGLRIDNCTIEINAPETPGCDGSSRAFVEALGAAGAVELDRERETLVIDRPIAVREGRRSWRPIPASGEGLVLGYHLDYGRASPIGAQSFFVDVSPETFRDELATSRTFLLEAEAQALRAAGIGARATDSDLLIFGADGVDRQRPALSRRVRPAQDPRHGRRSRPARQGPRAAMSSPTDRATSSTPSWCGSWSRPSSASGWPARHGPSLRAGDGYRGDPARSSPIAFRSCWSTACSSTSRAGACWRSRTSSYNEPFFQGHWPDRPIMPGVLIVEALAQAGGIMIADIIDSKLRAALIVAIDNVKIRRPVVPGRPASPGSDRPPAQVEPRRCPRRGQGRRPGCGRGQDSIHDRR